jgi:flagellar protein FliL
MKETKIDLVAKDFTPKSDAANLPPEAAKRPLPPKTKKDSSTAKKRPLLLYGIIGLALILGGGITLAFLQGWISLPAKGQGQKPGSGNLHASTIGPMLKISPLVINLKEERGFHYIKTTIVLEMQGIQELEEMKARLSSITDMVILTLGDKRFEDLKEPIAKENLKKELLAKANQLMGNAKIKQIYFDEFIYQ